jgi:hypothetical protein
MTEIPVRNILREKYHISFHIPYFNLWTQLCVAASVGCALVHLSLHTRVLRPSLPMMCRGLCVFQSSSDHHQVCLCSSSVQPCQVNISSSDNGVDTNLKLWLRSKSHLCPGKPSFKEKCLQNICGETSWNMCGYLTTLSESKLHIIEDRMIN